VYVEFHVDYRADMDLVQSIAEDVPQHSKYFEEVEPPQSWVTELGKESIQCMVVAWATLPADGWILSVDIRNILVKRLQEHEIHYPYLSVQSAPHAA
jgi:small-conductance mechanosensitive channel